MAIRMRRGAFANFDKAKMVDGEFAFVRSGDTATSSGKAVYACFSPGDVQRLMTYDEVEIAIADAIERLIEQVTVDPDDLGLVFDAETSYVYPTYKGTASTHGVLIDARQTLAVENSNMNTKAMLKNLPEQSHVRLMGIQWECEDANEILYILNKLDTMRGIDENGDDVATARVSGTIHTTVLSQDLIDEFSARYPSINFTCDTVGVMLAYATYDGLTILKYRPCVNGVPQGTAPSAPSREPSAQYSYNFVGWSKTADSDTADADAETGVFTDRTIYAAYEAVERTFRVRFMNGTTVLQTTTVTYGQDATYTGTDPVDPSGTRAFVGWIPQPTNITEDTDCIAQFKQYVTLTFMTYDGSAVLKTVTCIDGVPQDTPPAVPTRAPDAQYIYTGIGWSYYPDSQTADADTESVYINRSVYAAYSRELQTYTVRFYYGNTLLQTSTDIAYGSSATYNGSIDAIESDTTKTFWEWSPAPTNIHEDTNCYAQFVEAIRPTFGNLIMDDWDTIISNLKSGNMPYSLGDYKPLYSSWEYSAGNPIGYMNMQIVGTGVTSGGQTTYDWLSVALTYIPFSPSTPWDVNTAHTILNRNFRQALPTNINNALVASQKVSQTHDGTSASSITTQDAVWVPSSFEMGFLGEETTGTTYSSVFNSNSKRIKQFKYYDGFLPDFYKTRTLIRSGSQIENIAVSGEGQKGSGSGSSQYAIVSFGFSL